MKKDVAPQDQDRNQDRNAPGSRRDGDFQNRPDGPDGTPASDQDIDSDEEEFADEDEDAELEEGDKDVD